LLRKEEEGDIDDLMELLTNPHQEVVDFMEEEEEGVEGYGDSDNDHTKYQREEELDNDEDHLFDESAYWGPSGIPSSPSAGSSFHQQQLRNNKVAAYEQQEEEDKEEEYEEEEEEEEDEGVYSQETEQADPRSSKKFLRNVNVDVSDQRKVAEKNLGDSSYSAGGQKNDEQLYDRELAPKRFDTMKENRIVGGTTVTDDLRYPWFVQAKDGCGGALIAPDIGTLC